MDHKGRVAVPASLGEQLGFAEGVTLLARTDGHKLILEQKDEIKRRLHARFAVVHGSMADELLAERRREAVAE